MMMLLPILGSALQAVIRVRRDAFVGFTPSLGSGDGGMDSETFEDHDLNWNLQWVYSVIGLMSELDVSLNGGSGELSRSSTLEAKRRIDLILRAGSVLLRTDAVTSWHAKELGETYAAWKKEDKQQPDKTDSCGVIDDLLATTLRPWQLDVAVVRFVSSSLSGKPCDKLIEEARVCTHMLPAQVAELMADYDKWNRFCNLHAQLKRGDTVGHIQISNCLGEVQDMTRPIEHGVFTRDEYDSVRKHIEKVWRAEVEKLKAAQSLLRRRR